MISSTSIKGRFSAGQASKATRVPYHNVDYWATVGILMPSIEGADGPATCRVYGFRDLVALAVARELRSAGVNLKAARSTIEYVRDRDGYESIDQETIFLVADADGNVAEQTPSNVASALHKRGCACVVDLGVIVRELRDVIETLPTPQRGLASLITQGEMHGHGSDQSV